MLLQSKTQVQVHKDSDSLLMTTLKDTEIGVPLMFTSQQLHTNVFEGLSVVNDHNSTSN